MASSNFVVSLIVSLLFFLVNNPLRCEAGNVLYSVGAMFPGEPLNYDATHLKLHNDGELVMSNGTASVAWMSSTRANISKLTLDHNGILAVYNGPSGDLLRNISTVTGPSGDYLLVLSDMYPVIYGPGKYVSANHTIAPLTPTDADTRNANVLSPHETLLSGNSLKNAKWELKMQEDCDLVLYDFGAEIWSTGTSGKGTGCYLKMELTGDAVVYNESGDQIWSSDTSGMGVSVLVLRNDGCLVVYGPVLWDYPFPITPTDQSLDTQVKVSQLDQ